MSSVKKLWIGIGVLALLSPLGLILPEHFHAGSAWGEWGVDEMEKLVGYVPAGLARLAEWWKAPMPDYAFPGWEEKGLTHLSLAYIFSGILGAGLVALVAWWLGRRMSK